MYYIVTLELRGIYIYANRILNFSQPLFWISHKKLRGVWNTWTVNKFMKHLLWKAISANMFLGAALAWNSDKNIRRGESRSKWNLSISFVTYIFPGFFIEKESKKATMERKSNLCKSSELITNSIGIENVLHVDEVKSIEKGSTTEAQRGKTVETSCQTYWGNLWHPARRDWGCVGKWETRDRKGN